MVELVARTLVVAAHPDDEMLGCGATMARLSHSGVEIQTLFIADGESSRFSSNNDNQSRLVNQIATRRQSANNAAQVLGSKLPLFLDFPDNKLDTVPLLEIAKEIEKVVKDFHPTRILTHFPGDLNLDHRLTAEAVMVASRPQNYCTVKEVLFFETPSSTEWKFSVPPIFNPNYFVDVHDFLDLKFRAFECYSEENRAFPHPRSREALSALAAWRGSNAGLLAAEAFIVARFVL